MPRLKATILRIIFLLILTLCVSSCNKNKPIESSIANDVFNKNDKEQIEAFFLIATANASNAIISKSQIAQQKSSQNKILELSRQIESHQNHLLQEVSKVAGKKLVIITDIGTTNKLALYELIDTNDTEFDKAYINSLAKSIDEQIEVFESISKETNDTTILKLVLEYLPTEYQILRETQRIKQEINLNAEKSIIN